MTLHRTSIAAVLLALAALSALPSSAQAQIQQGQANFGNLIAALNNVDTQIRALEEANIQEVQVVNVKEIRDNLSDNQAQTLDNAYQDANTDALRDALENNEAITPSLNDNDVQVSDVVAVDVLGGETTAVVYVDPDDLLQDS